MYPLSSNSFICFFNSINSDGAILYGFLYMGVVPGASSMRNSISRSGGMPGSSSGNTSGNSHTTGTLFSSETSTLFNLGCRGLFPSLADTLIVFPWWCVRITVLLKQSMKPLLVVSQSIPRMTSSPLFSNTIRFA